MQCLWGGLENRPQHSAIRCAAGSWQAKPRRVLNRRWGSCANHCPVGNEVDFGVLLLLRSLAFALEPDAQPITHALDRQLDVAGCKAHASGTAHGQRVAALELVDGGDGGHRATPWGYGVGAPHIRLSRQAMLQPTCLWSLFKISAQGFWGRPRGA